NFAAFASQAAEQTGRPVINAERVADDGTVTHLDEALIGDADTIVVISFDSMRTQQSATAAEVAAIRRFLGDPEHVIVVCPHHDIGTMPEAEHFHHGDKAIPPRQAFGGFARTLLSGLGVSVENRFGLRPAVAPDGSPAPVEIDDA